MESVYYPDMYPDGRTDASGNFNLGQAAQNQAYACSPANPYFWGWSPFFNLVDAVAAQAAAAGVTIEEWDIDNEPDLENWTVLARLVYDNTTIPPTPVLRNVGQRLANHGFSAGVATLSVTTDYPTSAAFDCGSVYGDSAHFMHYSELMAATGGAMIGLAPYVAPNGGLGCDGSLDSPPPNGCAGDSGQTWVACATAGMVPIPAQAVPTVTDLHMAPCVLGAGGCLTGTDVTSTAENMFNDICCAVGSLLNWRNLTGNLMMFGETYANAPAACDGNTQEMTQEGVSAYLSSTLYQQDGANVVLRPWEWVMAAVCPTPAVLGAPAGPFTP